MSTLDGEMAMNVHQFIYIYSIIALCTSTVLACPEVQEKCYIFLIKSWFTCKLFRKTITSLSIIIPFQSNRNHLNSNGKAIYLKTIFQNLREQGRFGGHPSKTTLKPHCWNWNVNIKTLATPPWTLYVNALCHQHH